MKETDLQISGLVHRFVDGDERPVSSLVSNLIKIEGDKLARLVDSLTRLRLFYQ
jgi:hypothetical protein